MRSHARKVTHPFSMCRHTLPASHLVATCVIRSTVMVSQCLCSSHLILLSNGHSAGENRGAFRAVHIQALARDLGTCPPQIRVAAVLALKLQDRLTGLREALTGKAETGLGIQAPERLAWPPGTFCSIGDFSFSD